MEKRLCIIHNQRFDLTKRNFGSKGDHIIPKSLGNRLLKTPYVCKECNNAFGGNVDLALKEHLEASDTCPNRELDVIGAYLKIAYEFAHLQLGDAWLKDIIARQIREVLWLYVQRDEFEARKLIQDEVLDKLIHPLVDIDKFYELLGTTRDKCIETAVVEERRFYGVGLVQWTVAEQECLVVGIDMAGVYPVVIIVSFNAVMKIDLG